MRFLKCQDQIDFDVQPYQTNGSEIQFFLVKMALDKLTNQQAMLNYMNTYVTSRFCLYLRALCFLLESMHAFIKFAYMKNIFVHDLMIIIKVICQGDVYIMYCDPTFRFIIDNFQAFKSLLQFRCNNNHMWWTPNLNFKVLHLAFELNG